MNALLLAAAYLLGSIPFSFLVARRYGIADVRRTGSGNVGASNVMRVAGKAAGALAFVLDASKGAAAALLAQVLQPDTPLAAQAAVAAVVGHLFPVWLGFRGGKGVATGAGAFLPLAPWPTLGALASFALLLALFRYVSLASLGATLVLVAALLLSGAPPAVAWAGAAVGALVFVRHHENIARLLAGNERRIGAAPAGTPDAR